MRALWSDRPICSHNVSQKVKRIRRPSDSPFQKKFKMKRKKTEKKRKKSEPDKNTKKRKQKKKETEENGKNGIGSEQKRPGANWPPEFVPESPLQKGFFGSHIFSKEL